MTDQNHKDLLQILCFLDDGKKQVTPIEHKGDGVFEIMIDDTKTLSGTSETALYKVQYAEVKKIETLSIGIS